MPNTKDKYDEIREMFHTDTRKRKQIEKEEKRSVTEAHNLLR